MRSVRIESSGFSLIELAIVVMIVGTLAAISIPNFMRFAQRAKEASVKENMHVIQTGIEVFAADNDGSYPLPADEPLLKGLMPQGEFPNNPFTQAPTPVTWNADPGIPGEISITNLPGGGYMLKGHGANNIINPPIRVGN